MKTKLCHFFIGFVLLGFHVLTLAEVPVSIAETLMRKSGAWAALGDMAAQIQDGIVGTVKEGSLSENDVKRLGQLAEGAFAADRLRTSFLQVLSQRVTHTHSADALRWYNSPTGRLIAGIEGTPPGKTDETSQVLADGNQILAKASSKRQRLLNQTVKATRAIEALATVQIITTVSVLRGVANVLNDQPRPSVAELRQAFEALRPEVEIDSNGFVLSMFAHTYQSASDNALEQYVRFRSSTAGVALTIAMNDALYVSLSEAAHLMGNVIPNSLDAAGF